MVGSGPAGSATALALRARIPRLAARTLVFEKARHPREKTCAGGLIPRAERVLAELGLELTVPYVQVDRARIVLPEGSLDVDSSGLCKVVRRAELDSMLVQAARDRGIELREQERVVGLARECGGVRVETERATYWARVVVGADGCGSLVRRALVPGAGGPMARGLMADIALGATSWDGFAARRYEFCFSDVPAGLRGYRWAFPCSIGGVPHVNIGVYALGPRDGRRLRELLSAEARRVGAEPPHTWRAFPIHCYAPGRALAAPHAVLVGDAAGVDPLMGEGISHALEYALAAAQAIEHAYAAQDFSFGTYASAVRRSHLGRKLRRLALAAGLFYGPTSRVWFRLAAVSRRAQAIALSWYNGAGGWDEKSAMAAIGALVARRVAPLAVRAAPRCGGASEGEV